MPIRDVTLKCWDSALARRMSFDDFPGYRQIYINKYEKARRKYLNEFDAWDYNPSLNEAMNGVYIGNEGAANSPELLKSMNISNVICMAEEIDLIDAKDILYMKYGVHDGQLVPRRVLNWVADEISGCVEAKQKVLVHCAAGISRSATAVIAYAMKHHKMGWELALNTFRQTRPIIAPHPLMLWSLMDEFGDDFIE